jgi:hypothetical protein
MMHTCDGSGSVECIVLVKLRGICDLNCNGSRVGAGMCRCK